MSLVPAPNQSQIFTALRSFLTSILPTGVDVLRGQANRVPEPAGVDFVIMTPLRQRRIETNVDTYGDVLFTASIAGTTMLITGITFGAITPGAQLFGTGLASGTTTVVRQLSGGSGSIGTYLVSLTQSMAPSFVTAGFQDFLQPSEIVVQLDVHGPNSADNTQTITTLFRDDFAVQQFMTSGFDVAPLYADDPRQVPFINAESQYEDRWIIEAYMQANQIVSAAQQFASIVEVTLVEADGGTAPDRVLTFFDTFAEPQLSISATGPGTQWIWNKPDLEDFGGIGYGNVFSISNNVLSIEAYNAFVIDGSAVNSTNGNTQVSVTLSTTNPNDFVFVSIQANSGPVTQVQDTANLVWARLATSGGGSPIEVWWAIAANPLVNYVITVTQSASNFMQVVATAVSGVNTASPFDGVAVTGSNDPLTISTDNPTTMVFGNFRSGTSNPTAGNGYTPVEQGNFQVVEYQVFTSPQTNLGVTLGFGQGQTNGAVAFALVAASGTWHAGIMASVDTAGVGFAQQYGIFEMRAKFPAGGGSTWPAFWLLAQNHITSGLTIPDVEIDIIEQFGNFNPTTMNMTYHHWLTPTPVVESFSAVVGDMEDSFHTYTLTIDEDFITWFFDGNQVAQMVTPTEAKTPLYVLVDLALSGDPLTWSQATVSPSYMQVEYVQVWQWAKYL